MKTCYLSLLMFFCLNFVLLHSSEAHRDSQLRGFFKSWRPSPRSTSSNSVDLLSALSSPVYVSSDQYGMMEADKIRELPGQPSSVDFNQYSGYVTVDSLKRKALFYYFVESPNVSSEKPLILWLTGGPACSSLMGAMEDIGPFRVNNDGETLYKNDYAWNNVANIIFLDTPAGVGFSYSSTTADHDIYDDDRITADSYIFLLNWFVRFPQYKGRDFYIMGEGYAGHHVPQLASTIYRNNNVTHHNTINLQGIAVGNGYFDDLSSSMANYDFFLSHALISDQTYELHTRALKCYKDNNTAHEECPKGLKTIFAEIGDINFSNIYAPVCHNSSKANSSGDAITHHDPCSYEYVCRYLSNPAVQKALHAHLISQPWKFCSNRILETYKYGPTTMLPTIKFLVENGVPTWFYSGDLDASFPTISTRYFIKSLGLNVTQPWRPWHVNNEVGGYVEEYKGITFVTVRGAGHYVQTDQPERALTMISSFLEGKLPPP